MGKVSKPVVLAADNFPVRLLLIKNSLSDITRVYAVKSRKSVMFSIKNIDKPNLILLDLEMPFMFGFEFLDFLKNSSDYINIPVIVITSSPQSTIEEKLKNYDNIAGVLGKPFEPSDLRELAAVILGITAAGSSGE